MSQSPQPHPDLNLPYDTYYELVQTLCAALPEPVGGSMPEDFARRDRAAIAQVAALVPVNAEEANLAAHYVAAGAHAMECLRQAQGHVDDPKRAGQLMAQYTTMMRQARAHRSLLLRVQAARAKREATTTSRESAAWTEHCVLGLMLEALSGPSAAPSPPDPPFLPAAVPGPASPACAEPAVEEPVEAPVDPAAEADTYAVLYPVGLA